MDNTLNYILITLAHPNWGTDYLPFCISLLYLTVWIESVRQQSPRLTVELSPGPPPYSSVDASLDSDAISIP